MSEKNLKKNDIHSILRSISVIQQQFALVTLQQ